MQRTSLRCARSPLTPTVRSQPEVWCWCHVSRSSEQQFTARGPSRGANERSTPQASSVSRYGALRIGPRALSREQHANRPAHLLTPCLRFSAPGPHFASGRAPIGPSRLVSRRNRSQGGNAPSFRLSIVLASGPSVGFPLQSPAGPFEAIGRHAWGQCPSLHQEPSCGLTSACSGLASLAPDARR